MKSLGDLLAVLPCRWQVGAVANSHPSLRVSSRVRLAPPPCFVAIDFETADRLPDSACAVGLVRVEEGRIVAKEHRLIRPPRHSFAFTWLHGISWADVVDASVFAGVWAELQPIIEGAGAFLAHNASFDRRVLEACCQSAGIAPPSLPFQCTVRLARSVLGIRPTNLANVCLHLSIPLKNHDALSDAEACARIGLAAGNR